LINITYVGQYQTLSNTNVLSTYNLNATAITRVYLQQQNDVMVMPTCTISTAVSLATLQQEIKQLQDEVSNLTTSVRALSSNLTSIIAEQNILLSNLTSAINHLASNITSVVDIEISNLTLANEKQAAQIYNLTSIIESQNSGLRLLVIAVLIVSLITLIIILKRS
jgi:3-methyladenine DNA glycosylase AlkD